MRYIDPPSRLFSSNRDWIEFLQEMRLYPDDPEAREQAAEAEAELELRGVDIKHLTSA